MNAFRQRRAKDEPGYDILPPDALGSRAARRVLSRGVVEDAHFVPVPGEPRPTSPHGFHNDNSRTAPRVARKPMPSRKPSGSPRPKLVERIESYLMRMSADFFSAVVAFVFVMVFGLAGGFSLINSGSQAPASGLDLTHVTLTPQDGNGMQLLQINGIVENRTGALQKVSPIRAELVVEGKTVFSTTIAPPVAEIADGQSRGFMAKIPHPGGKRPQLKLSFDEAGAKNS